MWIFSVKSVSMDFTANSPLIHVRAFIFMYYVLCLSGSVFVAISTDLMSFYSLTDFQSLFVYDVLKYHCYRLGEDKHLQTYLTPPHYVYACPKIVT